MTIQVREKGLADPVDAVTVLTELIRAECADMDTTRKVPTPVIGALQDAGVFRLMAPVEIGGSEVDPVTFLNVVEAASHADGSVGWCVMIGGCYATFGGLLPLEGARSIYGDPATISAGAFRPDGMAVEVDGGFRITGRWPLASGSSHANWYVGGCVVVRDGEPVIGPTGAPLMREAVLSRLGHRDHRHLGLHRPARHGQSRLRHLRRVRPRVPHDVVPGAAHHRPAAVPHAARRHVRHLHRRRAPWHRPPRHRGIREPGRRQDADAVQPPCWPTNRWRRSGSDAPRHSSPPVAAT